MMEEHWAVSITVTVKADGHIEALEYLYGRFEQAGVLSDPLLTVDWNEVEPTVEGGSTTESHR